jgi:hypothetical protein
VCCAFMVLPVQMHAVARSGSSSWKSYHERSLQVIAMALDSEI